MPCWGAGQMMFNKILVLTDEGVSIHNYAELAKYVFKNLNPATDINFHRDQWMYSIIVAASSDLAANVYRRNNQI